MRCKLALSAGGEDRFPSLPLHHIPSWRNPIPRLEPVHQGEEEQLWSLDWNSPAGSETESCCTWKLNMFTYWGFSHLGFTLPFGWGVGNLPSSCSPSAFTPPSSTCSSPHSVLLISSDNRLLRLLTAEVTQTVDARRSTVILRGLGVHSDILGSRGPRDNSGVWGSPGQLRAVGPRNISGVWGSPGQLRVWGSPGHLRASLVVPLNPPPPRPAGAGG